MTLGKQTSELGQRFLQTQESSLCVLLMNRSIPRPSGYSQQTQGPRLTGSLLKCSVFYYKQPDTLIPTVFLLLAHVKSAFLIDILVINTILTLLHCRINDQGRHQPLQNPSI